MATVESLRNQVEAIRAKVGRSDDPKHWVLEMPEGADIPECIARHLGPYDTMVIVEVMPGYFSGISDELGSCTVITTGGNFIVDMQGGRWTAVKQSASRRR